MCTLNPWSIPGTDVRRISFFIKPQEAHVYYYLPGSTPRPKWNLERREKTHSEGKERIHVLMDDITGSEIIWVTTENGLEGPMGMYI